jgi:hypothetical protein
MTMSKDPAPAATSLDPYGWRAGAARVLANASIVLLAFEAVSLATGVAQIVSTGPPPPVSALELLLLVVVFVFVRWLFVLPGLLAVLVGIEYVARRVPHARLLTAIVAFGPMVVLESTKSQDGLPISVQGAVLGVTALLFAAFARLPAGPTPAGRVGV